MSEPEKAHIDESDVGIGTILAIEEILRQLFKANLLDREALAAAIEGRQKEFAEDAEAGLRSVLRLYSDTIVRKGAK